MRIPLRYVLLLLVVLAVATLGVRLAPTTDAGTPTITVNTTADDNGDCNDGNCSLREAINVANDTFINEIRFNIAGSGPHVIAPLTPLPQVSESVVIDGTSEPDYSGTPIIVVDGSVAAAGSGLFLTGSDTVSGLVICNWPVAGIEMSGTGENAVSDSFIGTNVNSTSAQPNGIGVLVESDSNTIGGQDHGNIISGNTDAGVNLAGDNNVLQANSIGLNFAGNAVIANGIGVAAFGVLGNLIGGGEHEGNVISGNTGRGISLSNAPQNVIKGNLIGTDAAGTSARPNSDGIYIDTNSLGTVIGGTGSFDTNTISGNSGHGIALVGGSNAVIQGNRIGAGVTGAGVPNGGDGVIISTSGGVAQNNTIGGTEQHAGNLIAFNAGNGVEVRGEPTGGANGNTIRGNAMIFNGALGIDLYSKANVGGVSPNDAGDVDSGANHLQNYPVLAAVTGGPSLLFAGTLESTADTSFALDFYATPNCDQTGYGEGTIYLSGATVSIDASGTRVFNGAININVSIGTFITMTATNLTTGDTSEFSQCMVVTAPGADTPTPTLTPIATSTPTDTPTATQAADTPTATSTLPANTPASTSTPPAASATPTRTFTPVSTPSGGIRGDSNCDGSINSIDAAVVLQVSAGLLGAPPCEANADANHDGDVNSLDAALILQFSAGLLHSL